jgi:flagellar basal-body rod protein FlgC
MVDSSYGNIDVMSVAGSALTAERLRMDIVASNIANVHTTHDAEGNYNPYKRKLVSFKTIYDQQTDATHGVTVNQVLEDDSSLEAVYDPYHPNANTEGYVFYPNVSVEREMVDMLSAKAAYEANVTSIQTFKSMFNSALEI